MALRPIMRGARPCCSAIAFQRSSSASSAALRASFRWPLGSNSASVPTSAFMRDQISREPPRQRQFGRVPPLLPHTTMIDAGRLAADQAAFQQHHADAAFRQVQRGGTAGAAPPITSTSASTMQRQLPGRHVAARGMARLDRFQTCG